MTFYRYFWLYKQLSDIKIENFIVYLGIISFLSFILAFVIYPKIVKEPIKLFLISLSISTILFGYVSLRHIQTRKELVANIRNYNISSIEYLRENVSNLENKYISLDSSFKDTMSKEEYIDIVLNMFYNNVDYRLFAEVVGNSLVIKTNNKVKLKINPKLKYEYEVNIETVRSILGLSQIYHETMEGLVK